jgi:hypothetical protein
MRPRRAAEQCLQLGQGLGQDRRVASPLDREAERSVQGRQLVGPKALGLPLAQSHPRDPFSPGHLVIDGHRVSPDPGHAG